MSFVLSSLGKPVRKRMRVTAAERPESVVDIDAGDMGGYNGQEVW